MWMQDVVKDHQRGLAQQAEQHALAQLAQASERTSLRMMWQRLTAWLRPAHRTPAPMRRQPEPKFGRKKTIVGPHRTLYADDRRS